MNHQDKIIEEIQAHQETVSEFLAVCVPTVRQIAEVCRQALKNGNKILLCGNGGSAADCQHIAAEFVGRFHKERKSLPAIALTTDTSILTAIGNDYGYDDVFRRQVEGLGKAGDVLIGISTSGNSVNVVNAVHLAKESDIVTIAFTGQKDSELSKGSDYCLKVPSQVTARIQECHILTGHLICSFIDDLY